MTVYQKILKYNYPIVKCERYQNNPVDNTFAIKLHT